MAAVLINATPSVATTLLSMALNVPEHEYYTHAHDEIRFVAVRAMLICCPSNINSLINRAKQLPDFEKSEQTIVSQENDMLKTLILGRYLTAQNKENLGKFFKDLPLKANL